jgi:hypothetical protein
LTSYHNAVNRFRPLATSDCSSITLKHRTSAAFAYNWWSIAAVALIAWIICGLVEARSVAAQDVPTATIEFSGGSVAAGIGYTWGSGTLVFEGKEYPVKVDGLTIVHVGASDYSASGIVYHLTKLSDIEGVYRAASAGVAVAGGATATTMKNDHAVVIEMTATHTGINLQLGPEGVTITLK